MRRLRRPTSLSWAWHSQRRGITTLDPNPEGIILEEGQGPKKAKYPLFEVPDLVLDLDAAGSPYTRPFHEIHDAVHQSAKWGHDPLTHKIASQAVSLKWEMAENDQAMRRMAFRLFNTAQLSDHDIFTVALLGGKNVSDSLSFKEINPSESEQVPDRNQLLINLRRHGIPDIILSQSASNVLPAMLHRQQLALAELQDPSAHVGEYLTESERLKKEIYRCTNLTDLKRVCSHILNPSSVVQDSHDLLDHVHSVCSKLSKTQTPPEPLENILKFVNNLTIKQLLNNKALNPKLTLFALRVSCKLRLMPSILQYLNLCLSMGFIDNSSQSPTMTSINTAYTILLMLTYGGRTTIGTRQDIFTLFIGLPPDTSKSLLGLNSELNSLRDTKAFSLRIQLLGELGALRLLWGLWQGPRGPDDTVFVKSFRRSAQLLAGVEGVDTTTVARDEGDILLDLRNTNTLGSYYAAPTPTMEELIPTEDILNAFNEKDIGNAMSFFTELIYKVRKTLAKTADASEYS